LLEMPAVEARIQEGAEPADALIAVLREAVDSLGQSQYRNLLEIVLGLNRRTAPMSAGERRHLAGIEFRGGSSPVTAGTIRQHHEPKALDQLAAQLVAQAKQEDHRLRAPTEWLEWHPAVHAKWSEERLCLWRLAFSDFQLTQVVEGVQALMDEHQVRTWAVHEMLGVYDLLIEAWLPVAVPVTALENGFKRTFHGLLILDPFFVEEVVSHWAWRSAEGAASLSPVESFDDSPPSRELVEIENGSQALLNRYREKDLVERVWEGPGIRFLLLITTRDLTPPMPMGAKGTAVEALLSLLREEEGGLVEKEILLRGTGFAHLVLRGSVRPDAFHLLSERLVRPLQEALHGIWMRPQLFVLSGNEALARHASLVGRAPEEPQPEVEDLLQQLESSRFQVRLAAVTDLLPGGEVGKAGPSSQATEVLMKTITGMLNGEGGTIVVGAVDRDRVPGDPRLAGRIEGAPVLGRYAITGTGFELGGDEDKLLQRVLSSCHEQIEPNPQPFILAIFRVIEGRPILVITVREPKAGWFYYHARDRDPPEFIVQSAIGRETLTGAAADQYKRFRARS